MLEKLRKDFKTSENLNGLYEARMHIKYYNRDRVEKCVESSIKNVIRFFTTDLFVLKR